MQVQFVARLQISLDRLESDLGSASVEFDLAFDLDLCACGGEEGMEEEALK